MVNRLAVSEAEYRETLLNKFGVVQIYPVRLGDLSDDESGGEPEVRA